MTAGLQDKVRELASELDVPGVAVGILHDGREEYAFHGVTSVDNPLPVDGQTLFQFGSTGKTFTATAILRLAEQGKIDLDAPVKTYVPELKLKDREAAETVTVLNLLNHTAGWEGDLIEDTSAGDDALERYVERMAELVQTSPPGQVVSYNNASLSLAGRIIEKVTGTTFEKAMQELVLDPLGLDCTFFFPNDIMTRRFVVGHTRHEDGRITVSRPWALPRSGNPAGGMSATAADQIAWARFHLGDGTARGGARILEEKTLRRMQEPTAYAPGSAIGDAVGISWLLREVNGVKLVQHGGTTIGQYSGFVMVPERGFALISMTNCGPNGPEFNHRLEQWALEQYLGVREEEPEPIERTDEELAAYVGRYETVAVTCHVKAAAGRLVVKTEIKPEAAAMLRDAGEDPDEEQPDIPLAFVQEGGERVVVPEGPAKGMKGYFVRDADGHLTGVHLGGRLATRVAEPAPA